MKARHFSPRSCWKTTTSYEPKSGVCDCPSTQLPYTCSSGGWLPMAIQSYPPYIAGSTQRYHPARATPRTTNSALTFPSSAIPGLPLSRSGDRRHEPVQRRLGVLLVQVLDRGLVPLVQLLRPLPAEHRLVVDRPHGRLVHALEVRVEHPQAVVHVLPAHPEGLVVQADPRQRRVPDVLQGARDRADVRRERLRQRPGAVPEPVVERPGEEAEVDARVLDQAGVVQEQRADDRRRPALRVRGGLE